MVKFPELVKIMALSNTSKKKLASVIGKAPAAITKKLEGTTEFKQSEMSAILKHFKELITANEGLAEHYPTGISTDIIFCENVHYSELKTRGA